MMIIDLFAGGGGASWGIKEALGRDPDIAINHDPEAVAMHKANHPGTRHFCQDVFSVRPKEATQGQPVGLLWASPDCKDFSKAKGGRPRSRKIRDLAWVVVRWARDVRPKVILLENVEEFREWGPLLPGGKRDPERKGETFNRWVESFRRLGYQVDWRELVACDYGAPTSRKRLFVAMRCDGRPIVWPEPTHGPKGSGLTPYRTAAECIDWSLPCPSIFMTRAEAGELRQQTGIQCKRPLAEKTLRRIAKGIQKFVIAAADPYIVTYYGPKGDEFRGQGLDKPLATQTAENRHALVTPFVSKINTGAVGSPLFGPLHTITAGGSPKRPSTGNTMALVAPALIKPNHGYEYFRGQEADKPLHTITAGGGQHALVAAFLAKHFGTTTGQDVQEPLHTLTGHAKHGLVVANLVRHFGQSIGQSPTDPAPTITAGGGGKTGLVAGHLVKMRGSNVGQGARDPLQTISAGGTHFGEIRAFLTKYYGQGSGQNLRDPAHTTTSKDRLGLVTVMVKGEPWVIADIGLRMLQPHELFLAQGFPPTYIIDRGRYAKRLTKSSQVRLVGNSVPPPWAEALARANCGQAMAEAAA